MDDGTGVCRQNILKIPGIITIFEHPDVPIDEQRRTSAGRVPASDAKPAKPG